MKEVVPKLETLPVAQRILWPQLSEVSAEFVLYGGTALSLQLGGRISVDFDFFTSKPLASEKLESKYSFLSGARLQQRALNTATFLLGQGIESVAISFFGGLDFGRVTDPVKFSDNGLLGAGLLDLGAQKIKVIQLRAEAKDYQDIHTLLSAGVTLEEMLGAACTLYSGFNPAISLKALSYFADIPNLDSTIQRTLAHSASRVRTILPLPKRSLSLLADLKSLGSITEEGQSHDNRFRSNDRDREIEM